MLCVHLTLRLIVNEIQADTHLQGHEAAQWRCFVLGFLISFFPKGSTVTTLKKVGERNEKAQKRQERDSFTGWETSLCYEGASFSRSMELLNTCIRTEIKFLFSSPSSFEDVIFFSLVFANSEVKENAVSLVLCCLAAAPAWMASLRAGHGCPIHVTGEGTALLPSELLLLKLMLTPVS